MSNSVDADKTAHCKPCHLDIDHLQKPLLIACGTERVKGSKKTTCLDKHKDKTTKCH